MPMTRSGRDVAPASLVIEIDERIEISGRVIKPLDEAQARAELKKLKAAGVEAIAVCTLWATQNPVHERRLRELIKAELPGVFVSVSHEISPNVGEYARMSTTAANAAARVPKTRTSWMGRRDARGANASTSSEMTAIQRTMMIGASCPYSITGTSKDAASSELMAGSLQRRGPLQAWGPLH